MLVIVVYGCIYLAKGADVGGCCIWMYMSSEGGQMLGVVVYGCIYLAKGADVGGCCIWMYV